MTPSLSLGRPFTTMSSNQAFQVAALAAENVTTRSGKSIGAYPRVNAGVIAPTDTATSFGSTSRDASVIPWSTVNASMWFTLDVSMPLMPSVKFAAVHCFCVPKALGVLPPALTSL